jgi:transcriptional regulator with XRE-family HTH domain
MPSTPTPQTVGQRILESRGPGRPPRITREQLAAAAKVSVDTIKRWERGSKPGPTFIALCAIAEVVQRPVEWFMVTDGDREADGARSGDEAAA